MLVTLNSVRSFIQMLVKKKRLLLENIPGLQNPSDGLTKSFKFREMLINLEKEVCFVPGLDTNGLSFFSVLRLCGSRQVVAHCCAD